MVYSSAHFVHMADRGQRIMYDNYLRPKRPNGQFAPEASWFGYLPQIGSQIRDPLYKVICQRVRIPLNGCFSS